jgi:hypothetical protein
MPTQFKERLTSSAVKIREIRFRHILNSYECKRSFFFKRLCVSENV